MVLAIFLNWTTGLPLLVAMQETGRKAQGFLLGLRPPGSGAMEAAGADLVLVLCGVCWAHSGQ